MEAKNLWNEYSASELEKIEETVSRYKSFLDRGKTERESARCSIELAEKCGYRSLADCIASGKKLKAGDKVYAVYSEKLLALYHLGRRPMEEGMNILGAHIDSPRIDVKQNPLYEQNSLAYLDTHYYGGIKKYQWVTIPLAIHGVVIKKDGTKVDISIGESDGDPVFCITDLLIHLADSQMKKNASTVIEGEALDVLVGGRPLKAEKGSKKAKDAKGEEKEAVKAGVLKLLKDNYGIEEEDFLSAELEVVPAGKARDLGFDRSMVLAYGQDDRICAYTSLEAILSLKKTPARTACCLLVDKEEIGSVGASGMSSMFFENSTAEILALMGETSPLAIRRCLAGSRMLSSDVSAGFDPHFADVFEGKNAAYLGGGVVFNKFTGSRGKSGSNDANPEFIAKIRKIFADRNVTFHTAELGKVDVGGGGTIAYIMAKYGMEVIDCGLAVLCMHAPYEVSSKIDIHEAVRGYVAFLEEME